MCTNACCSTCRYSSFHALYAEISITGIVAVGYEDLAPYFEGPWVLEVDLDCTTCIVGGEEVYTHANKRVNLQVLRKRATARTVGSVRSRSS